MSCFFFRPFSDSVNSSSSLFWYSLNASFSTYFVSSPFDYSHSLYCSPFLLLHHHLWFSSVHPFTSPLPHSIPLPSLIRLNLLLHPLLYAAPTEGGQRNTWCVSKVSVLIFLWTNWQRSTSYMYSSAACWNLFQLDWLSQSCATAVCVWSCFVTSLRSRCRKILKNGTLSNSVWNSTSLPQRHLLL